MLSTEVPTFDYKNIKFVLIMKEITYFQNGSMYVNKCRILWRSGSVTALHSAVQGSNPEQVCNFSYATKFPFLLSPLQAFV